MKILVTGATGFVGQALLRHLHGHQDHSVRAAVRSARPVGFDGPCFLVGNINSATNWQAALEGIDVLIHLAARVHVMHDTAADPLAEFRAVNVAGTRNLAEQAAAAGVRRMVLLSSIKVLGEATPEGHPWTAHSPAAPADPYGVSKHEAERALREVAAARGMEWVVLRPPLVYGPGVKANFAALIRLASVGLPLPFASIDNRRSLVSVGNLVDALTCAATHPAAAGRTYLVSDQDDVSTPELIRRIALAQGRVARLFACPVPLLRAGATVLGRNAAMHRLTQSLQVDCSDIGRELGWRPPQTMAQALTAMLANTPAGETA